MSSVTEIINQHSEESAFLWILRNAAIHAPHYNLKDLAHLENRLEAHLDGLRIAGDDGWSLCKQALAFEEPGEVFAATVMALESGDPERLDIALLAGTVSDETLPGFISALGWLPYELIQPFTQTLLASQSPQRRLIGISARSLHRRDPGHFLADAVNDPDPRLQARALRAVGELRRHDLLGDILRQFNNPEESCTFWAAWSAVLLREAKGIPLLQQHVEQQTPFCTRALQLVLRVIELADAHHWLDTLKHQPAYHRSVVQGVGVIGDPAAMPWLIEQMPIPELARVAGESFTMITGIDIDYDDLDGDWPEGFEAGPNEDPADTRVALDEDEDLPWPDAEKISAWWSEHRGEFSNGTRYLLGQPITVANCLRVLRDGYQRQRHAAALELALRQPHEPLFETRAPAKRQSIRGR